VKENVIQVRVRGIYSTALCKLFLDHGFTITQASSVLAERLNIEKTMYPPNVEVYDTKNRQGVVVVGEREPLEKTLNAIREEVEDVVTRRPSVNLNAIYMGRIIRKFNGKAIADIGHMRIIVTPPFADEGKVQLLRISEVDPKPIASGKISIAGKYVVLTTNNQIGVSNKIKSKDVRKILYHFGEKMKPVNMGIIFRTAAGSVDLALVSEEIEKISKEMEEVINISASLEEPTLVREGEAVVVTEFPASAKRALDDVRKSVVPTVKGHHFYKASGDNIACLVDFAEEILSRHPELHGEISSTLERKVLEKNIRNGNEVKIEHVKPNGKIIYLYGRVAQAKLPQGEIVIRRTFRGKGYYDGLNVPKDPGDHGVTIIMPEEWFFKTEYYSKDGTFKGAFYNINTPIEVYPHKIRYIDLEIDVVEWPDGTVRVIDQSTLEEAYIKGYIPRKLKEKAEKVAERIMNEIVNRRRMEK